MVCASSVVKRCVGLLILLVFCGVAASLPAQVAGGTISGTVTDASGRVVNNVQITITNVATGVTRDVTTNDEGFYSAPNLLPGTYEAKFSAKGFNTEARKGIELTVGASIGLDQTMRVGSVGETIVVESEVPAIQLSTSDISAVVNATTVRELPLNGRSWTDLAQLQPGVNTIQTQPNFAAGTDRGNRGFGQQLTISGCAAAAEQLSVGRRQPQRLRQRCTGQRVGRKSRRRRDRGILCADQQLCGGLWQDLRRCS